MTIQEWKALRRLAISGDPEAEFDVGLWYDEGLVDRDGHVMIKPNPRRAVFWFRRSAEHGNPGAQNSLGYCLDTGHGIRKNVDEALFWYKKALKNGDCCAARNIATVYRDRGNQQRAFFWYQRAVEDWDDGDALVEVGWRYYYGVGVRRNYQAAVDHYRQAIETDSITEAGKQEAMYYLGIAYLEGKGVEMSLSTAMQWFEQANADGDHLKAQEMLDKVNQLSANKHIEERQS